MEHSIRALFAHHTSLSFNQIEKKLSVRSNKLAYHLNKLVKAGLLVKEGATYRLADSLESDIPYLSDKKSVIPVVLIHVGNEKEAFLIQRKKRPYQGLFGLPGGRLLQGESISQAAKRIMKEKADLDIIPQGTKSIALEHVRRNGKVVHSFLLIVIQARPKKPADLHAIKSSKKIIASDKKLIRQISKSATIETLYSKAA